MSKQYVYSVKINSTKLALTPNGSTLILEAQKVLNGQYPLSSPIRKAAVRLIDSYNTDILGNNNLAMIKPGILVIDDCQVRFEKACITFNEHLRIRDHRHISTTMTRGDTRGNTVIENVYDTTRKPSRWGRIGKGRMVHSGLANSDDELEHFGIQGMKWGVRRYQNEDGSLTEAGRKRYGVNEKQARKLIDAEKKSPSSFNAELFKNKALDRFRLNNPESVELRNARIDFERAHATANNEANLAASRAVGGRSFTNLLNNDPGAIADYMSAGKAYMESPEVKKRLSDAGARLDKAERVYEKKGKEFIDQLLGEYGKLEMENEMSLAYDTKQKKIRKQTLSERAAFELYRSSGGRIRG